MTGLVLLLAAALPFMPMSVAALVTPVEESSLNQAGVPEAELEAMMAQAGMTFEELVGLVRVMGGVVLVLALMYAVLAVVAFRGAARARLALAVLTGLNGLPLLLITAASPASLFGMLTVAVAAVGVVQLYSRPATQWYVARKGRGALRSG